MNEEKINTLLVIGNGADLYIGLKSTFSDYINSKKYYTEKIQSFWENYNSLLERVNTFDGELNINGEFDSYCQKYLGISPIFYDKFKILNKDYKIKYGSMPNEVILLIKNILNTFSNNGEMDKINFWDLLLFVEHNDNINWYDAEKTIKNFLISYKSGTKSYAEIFNKVIKEISYDRKHKTLSWYILNAPTSIIKPRSEELNYLLNDKHSTKLFLIFYLFFYRKLKNKDNFDIYRFLKEELDKFENSFESYLLGAIQDLNNSELLSDGETVTNRLYDKLNYNLFRILSKHDNSNLLNFNYTRALINDLRGQNIIFHLPVDEKKDPYNIKAKKKFKIMLPNKRGKIFHQRNIHGSVKHKSKYMNSSIILGIDTNYYNEIPKDNTHFFENNPELKENIDSFTKARRIMDFSGIDSSEDYRSILDPNINKIRFFGHSLGDADYSYFQAIFDFYNIYSNQIILEFVYSIHYDEFDSSTIEVMDNKYYKNLNYRQIKKQNDKVFKLINDYGKTLDNPNHGNNLLQKLLTEGRLRIVSIDDLVEYDEENN